MPMVTQLEELVQWRTPFLSSPPKASYTTPNTPDTLLLSPNPVYLRHAILNEDVVSMRKDYRMVVFRHISQEFASLVSYFRTQSRCNMIMELMFRVEWATVVKTDYPAIQGGAVVEWAYITATFGLEGMPLVRVIAQFCEDSSILVIP